MNQARMLKNHNRGKRRSGTIKLEGKIAGPWVEELESHLAFFDTFAWLTSSWSLTCAV